MPNRPPTTTGSARPDPLRLAGALAAQAGVAQAREREQVNRRAANAFRGDRPARLLGGKLLGKTLVPHEEQYSTQWNTGLDVLYSRGWDEALRDNWTNALALGRSEFVKAMIIQRSMPTVGLDWHIDVDDPKDPDQARFVGRMTKLVESVPRFQTLHQYLLKSFWYGRYASQLTWDRVMIDGRPGVTVTNHEPVDGDSLVFKFDGTPGVLIRQGGDWKPSERDRRHVEPADKSWIQPTDRAQALFLYDPFWRDHFIIRKFNPSSSDFMFEGDRAAAVHGVGWRSDLYWALQLREELRGFALDALQRVGANGMIYGFFEEGNQASADAIVNALKSLIRDNVSAFPVSRGQTPAKLEHIDPSQVGYEVIFQWIDKIEEMMWRVAVGQSLSSQAESTGLGSEVASLHRSTFENFIRYDAKCSAECFTTDLLGPMIRMNDWEWRGKTLRGSVPFRARFTFSVDKEDVDKKGQAVKVAFDMGLPLDKEQVYEALGLSPPKDDANLLQKPEGMPGAPGDGGPPGAPGQAPAARPGAAQPGATTAPTGKAGDAPAPVTALPPPSGGKAAAPAARARIVKGLDGKARLTRVKPDATKPARPAPRPAPTASPRP